VPAADAEAGQVARDIRLPAQLALQRRSAAVEMTGDALGRIIDRQIEVAVYFDVGGRRDRLRERATREHAACRAERKRNGRCSPSGLHTRLLSFRMASTARKKTSDRLPRR
jgi:hypothetical protein